MNGDLACRGEIRCRHNVVRDNNDDRGLKRCTRKPITKDKRAQNEHPHRRRRQLQTQDDRSVCHLKTATAILSVAILGASIYLARLILVNPDLHTQLPPCVNEFVQGHQWLVSSLPFSLKPTAPMRKEDLTEDEDFLLEETDLHTDETKETVEATQFSTRYIPTDSMPHIGDKSEKYARLRQEWDEDYPRDYARSLGVVEALRKRTHSFDSVSQDYDVYNCPYEPPLGYPKDHKTIDILRHWPPTQRLPRGHSNATKAHLGICVFDYHKDYEKALEYRSRELPFVVRNDPSVAETVERWKDSDYRRALFGGLDHSGNAGETHKVSHRAERAITNQVLFRHVGKKRTRSPTPMQGTKPILSAKRPPMPPPTKLIPMTYEEWYERSMEKERSLNETGCYDTNPNGSKESYYYYFRLVGCGEKDGCEKNSTEYLFDELPFFQPRRDNSREDVEDSSEQPTRKQNLYLVEPEKQRGIHCRFGMPGMIAANHYDASRNAIVVLGGSRRYILSRPQQCPNLGLFPMPHPSARHSRVDWTTASDDYQKLQSTNAEESSTSSDLESWDEYNKALSLLVNHATSTEVILQAGDVLYLPSYWFHYIISLDTNMQCNTRSGRDDREEPVMTECGFPPPDKRKNRK